MYPKLHFIQQNIVSTLCGSHAINQTMSKKSWYNLFAQVVSVGPIMCLACVISFKIRCGLGAIRFNEKRRVIE